uniref:CCHC-type domain-containing protein n=1 Tax=Tanacetum cinerariifolium TaxID=118510 RepID=A0A6L2N8E7_TANCI|nr:hypothetical protein [Tanacetum cinerariifolium]
MGFTDKTRAEGNGNGNNQNQVRCYNCRGLGHLARNYTVRPRRRDAAYLQTQLLIAQKEEAGIQLQAEEFDLMAAAADLDEIEEVNANYGTTEVHDYENYYNNEKFNMFTQEEQYNELLKPIPEPDQLSKEKSNVSSILEEKKKLKSDFKIREDERLDKEIHLENKIKKLDNILVKTGQSIQMMHMLSPKPDTFYHTEQKMALGYQNPFYLKQAQQKQQSLYDGNVLLEKHNPPAVYDSEETLELAQESRLKMKQLNKEIKPANYTKINHLLGVFVSQTAKSHEELRLSNTLKTAHVSKSITIPNEDSSDDTTPSIARKFLNELSEQKDITKGMSVNTHFCKQSILENPPSSSGSKIYAVTPFLQYKVLPKIDEPHALSKPVTSNSVPTSQELKVVKNYNVNAPGMFRINPFKPSREEKYVPNKVKASVMTNLITISQPHVITKKDVYSDSNGLSSTRVDNTAKTKRPQHRSNTKNDKVPYASKSSCSKNKEGEVEEHLRNLPLSKNKKHMSFECNNVKLAIRNDKSEVVCAMCKQCLITANHDVCVLNNVNDMNSRGTKQKANVSNTKNQMKHKTKVMKP